MRRYRFLIPSFHFYWRATLIVCFVGFVAPTIASGIGQEIIPLRNWAYDALDRFETLGLCNVPDDRPFSRPEFVELVTEISSNAYDRRLSARDRYNLDRLEKEYTDFASRQDPQARYDPPTFFLEDRPLVFEMDLDLAGIAARPFLDEFGTEYYANSNPEMRLHFSDRVTYDVRYRLIMGPEHGDRARNEKPSRREKSFKGLTSLYERSYVIFGWKNKVHVLYGRDYLHWGPSHSGSLITPAANISLDQLAWRAKLKWFRLSIFNSQLWPYTQRYLAGHRLEMRFSRVTVGLNETIVYAGRDWDWIYAFPLSSFYANQFNERTNDDNIFWSADVKVSFLNHMTVYAALLIDDFQFERDGKNPDKLGFDIGGRMAFSTPIATTWRANYRFVDIYTYTHYNAAVYYVSGGGELDNGDVLLGGEPGPDSDNWQIEGDFYPRPEVILTAAVFSQRLGESNDPIAYQPGDPVNPKFPSGTVQRTQGGALKLRWELARNSWIEGFYSYARISNFEHEAGRNETTDAFSVAVRIDF